MKQVMLFLLLCTVPAVAFCHTRAEYTAVMKKFQACYNAGQPDSITHLFAANAPAGNLWAPDMLKERMEEYGTITSCKYIGHDEDTSIALFLMAGAEKKKWVTALSLTNDRKLSMLRFDAKSAYISRKLLNRKLMKSK